jgi:hypothetical protein
MQSNERAVYHSEKRHHYTEENRIGQYGENSSRNLSFGGCKKYRILTDKRKNKSHKELQHFIRQHKFREEKKRGLNGYPNAPNNICIPLTVFKGGGIDPCDGVCHE